jgi:hypothetical protein
VRNKNRLEHFGIGDARREASPQVGGGGPCAVLFEAAPLAACGCPAVWELGEFIDVVTVTLHFGWRTLCNHSQACRKAMH